MRSCARIAVLLAALCSCGRHGFDDVTIDDGGGSESTDPDADSDADVGTMADDSTSAAAWATHAPPFLSGANLYTAVAFAANNYWVAGDNGDLQQFNGTAWVEHAVLQQDVYALWGATANDIWEVGALCEVHRWNGSMWSAVTPPMCGNASMFSIGGGSATDFWVGGVSGYLYHYVNGTFSLMPQANNVDIVGIHAVATNLVYMVGTRGTTLRWNGAMLVDEGLPITVNLRAVWGIGANDAWAVGDGGRIYRKQNAGPWTSVQSPTTAALYGVWGTSTSDVWAVGDAGTALHFDGMSWKQVTMPTTMPLRAVTGIPGGGAVAVGDVGTVLKRP